jgi:3-isopropylmalate dehydrogenase
MMLEHLGEPAAATAVETAVAADLAARSSYGHRTTSEIGDALAERVS